MPRGASARRHAQAVFQIALESDQVERWRQDLRSLAQSLADRELLALLESPKLRFEEKTRVLGEVLTGVNPLALNLAYLLVSRGRLGIVADLVAEYERFADAHQGLEHAEVTAAIPLDEQDRERLAQRLSSLAGLKVVVSTRVDPAIIGGMVARIGDRLIDGSTRSRLDSLKRSLVEPAP